MVKVSASLQHNADKNTMEDTEEYRKVLRTSKITHAISLLIYFLGGIGIYIAITYNVQNGEGKMTSLGIVSAIIIGLMWHQASIMSRISREVKKFASLDAYAEFVKKESEDEIE